MTEAEVSLRMALYYIQNDLTCENVKVALDGAHIKTGDIVHFEIEKFMKNVQCEKIIGENTKWQGIYSVNGYEQKIELSSTPGIGDVVVRLKDGKRIYIESKKGKSNKSSQEYSLMREAIGQLMTGVPLTEDMIPMVAVPYTAKSYELANRWIQLSQIKRIGIQFALVHEDGLIDFVSSDYYTNTTPFA